MTERLHREYDKLVREMEGLEMTDSLGLMCYEENLKDYWKKLGEKAKTDEEKELVAKGIALFHETISRQRQKGEQHG